MTFEVRRRRRARIQMSPRIRTAEVKALSPDLLTIQKHLLSGPHQVFSWLMDFPIGQRYLDQWSKSFDRQLTDYFSHVGLNHPQRLGFASAALEAAANAGQHGTLARRFLVETTIWRNPDWWIVQVELTNPLPRTRRVALPEPKKHPRGSRGRGMTILTSDWVDSLTVTIRNGDQYAVKLVKFFGRPSASVDSVA